MIDHLEIFEWSISKRNKINNVRESIAECSFKENFDELVTIIIQE